MRVLSALLGLWSLAAVGAVATDVVLRPVTGPLALGPVVEQHLLTTGILSGVVAAALSLRRAGLAERLIRLVAALTLVVGVVRLGDEWWSPTAPPPDPGATTFSVLTWNLEQGSRPASVSVAGILAIDADVVAVQELTPDVIAALNADGALTDRYPYRILQPTSGQADVGILSRLPIVDLRLRDPIYLPVDILVGGTTVRTLVVHPQHGAIERRRGVPLALDSTARDAELDRIAGVVDGAPDPARVMVVGDLNTSPFEPGFAILADRLRDAHQQAGLGPGFTWRPSSLEWLAPGLLRIDHVLTGSALRALTATEDCSLAGDHCRLLVTLALEPEAAP